MLTISQNSESSHGKVEVTFSMPGAESADHLYLVGWFDEWNESVYLMERTPRGDWALTLELEPGCEYEYRFRRADGTWLRDPSRPAGTTQWGLNTSFFLGGPAQD
jgi:Glycogen recognition site of AMP-activated protein kinase